MKKALSLLLLGCTLSTALAQSWRTPFTKTAKNSEGIREYQYFNPHLSKSGIAVSYGYYSVSSFDWWAKNAMKSRPNGQRIYDNTNESSLGTFSIAYSNQLTPWLELTIPFTYAYSKGKLYDPTKNKHPVGDYQDNFFLVTPQIKISWIYNKFFHLYSRVGLGLGLGNRTEYISTYTSINSKPIFSWQISPVGFELGQRVSFFAEVGYGHMGVVNAGLKVRFNRSKDQSGRTRNNAIAEKHAWYKDMLR